MKTKEEIEQLVYGCFGEKEWTSVSTNAKLSLIETYTQCQEEMKKELYEFGKLVLDTFHSEGKTHSGKDRLARIKFDEWFNRLNKQDND